ncbi:Bax inhibitor-1/YccA family protein [Alloscardovia theropitheci]|nr:Bax inhibitor-1/YccA family protein [Alloscardovia theropitheci]
MTKSEGWYERNPWAKDRQELELGDSWKRSDLSVLMDQLLPEPLFKVRNQGEVAFSSRGVKIKALVYLALLTISFFRSYFFVDFNNIPDKNDAIKAMMIVPVFVAIVAFCFLFLVEHMYSVWGYAVSRICEIIWVGVFGYLFAWGVHDRPETLPIVISIVCISGLCIVLSGNLARALGNRRELLRIVGIMLLASTLVSYFLSLVIAGNQIIGSIAGLVVSGFAVVSFIMDLASIEALSGSREVYRGYEWVTAFCLVFDVVLCVVGMVKATKSN